MKKGLGSTLSTLLGITAIFGAFMNPATGTQDADELLAYVRRQTKAQRLQSQGLHSYTHESKGYIKDRNRHERIKHFNHTYSHKPANY
jgi:hypothetical protein